jgi:hypothetical protein
MNLLCVAAPSVVERRMDDPFRIQPDDGVPEALGRDLGRAYLPGSPIGVPTEVDERIAALARARLTGRMAGAAGGARGLSWGRHLERRRALPMRLITMTSAAAALLLVMLVGPRLSRTPTPGPGTTQIALFGDIDADGRVDIVDALVLSKRVREGSASQNSWDIDDDGSVTERDAHAIRAMVVSLEGGAG